jgi:hypothetical protein
MAKQYAGFSPYAGFVLNLSGRNWKKTYNLCLEEARTA